MATIGVRSTKDEVQEHIARISQELDGKSMDRYTAQEIGFELSISRSLASQYLNELVQDGLVIKVISRPVYFIHRRTIEQKYGRKLTVDSYRTVEELMCLLENRTEEKPDFQKAVGHDTSLSYCVEQCKAAMQYPPNGLPLMLSGATGTGTSFLAQLTYEYARRTNCLSTDGRLITIHCAEYREDGRQLFEALFNPQNGLVTQCNGGVLLFDMVHLLPQFLQHELFTYMDSFAVQQQALPIQQRTPSCRLVFTAALQRVKSLEKSFLRRIPIHVTLPEIEERSSEEKKQLILHFLYQEQGKMGMSIAVSPQAMSAFFDFRYSENLSQLENDIRIACANAYLHHDEKQDILELRLHHLPEELLSGYHAKATEEDDTLSLQPLKQLYSEARAYQAKNYYDAVLSAFRSFTQGDTDFTAMMGSWMQTLYAYDEYLVFSRKYDNSKIKAMSYVVTQVLELVPEQHNILLPANCAAMITRGICDMVKEQAWISRWEQSNSADIQQCLEAIQQNIGHIFTVAQSLDVLLSQNLNMPRENNVRLLFLSTYIHELNPRMYAGGTTGIIVSHGNSTASSIAHTVNQLLKSPVFTPFDMPLSSSEQEIVCRIRHFLQLRRFVRNVVILVDMGSLEDVGAGLSDLSDVHIGIINNISTYLALDIGSAILNGEAMERMLQQACDRSVSRYKTLINKTRKDAILFVHEAGENAVQRMMQLFCDSLPRKVDVDIMAYDLSAHTPHVGTDHLMEEYNVLFACGLFDPHMEGIPYIPVEDIINLMENPTVYQVFARHLSLREIETFQQTLLKNFSLENAVKHLTILDADRLLSFVEDALRLLQNGMGKNFTARTLLGLYIHISCMVERLVTKSYIKDYGSMQDFTKQHDDFVRQARSAFSGIGAHYHVEIPVSELGYIYDYIERDGAAPTEETDTF